MKTLRLFEGYGLELEYMIVDEESLDLRPEADTVLEHLAGEVTAEVEVGPVAWSNELVLHVVEVKTNGPAPSLAPLGNVFLGAVTDVDRFLRSRGRRLLGTAMHPWMDPATETRIWPHEYGPVYHAYDRIFGCRGHGWSNLQSLHVNLPFSGDEEMARLHAAIRLVLPLLPALAASSPFAEGRPTDFLDFRMETYRHNSAKIPSVAGEVVPETVSTRTSYERDILGRMYRDIAPHDPEGVLQHEFLNSRGAIVRFDRSAIEIRVLDLQETPRADVAVAAFVSGLVRLLVEERFTSLEQQQAVPLEPLADLFRRSVRDADAARVEDPSLLAQFGLPAGRGVGIGDLLSSVIAEIHDLDPWQDLLEVMLERGPLARRIVAAAGPAPDRDRLREVYRRLADCVTADEPFLP